MFVDCPKCGSEFIVNDAELATVRRCPDCLQWLESDDHMYAKSYYGNNNDSYYDDYDVDNYAYES